MKIPVKKLLLSVNIAELRAMVVKGYEQTE